MPATDIILGLSLSNRTVQAVEIEKNGPQNLLLAVDEWENTFHAGSEDGAGADEFLEYLTTFMKVNRVRAREASVALDTGLLFLATLPLPEGITRPEINEQLTWELGEYFTDEAPRDFISDVHILAPSAVPHVNEVLSVSVRRQVVRRVETVLGKAGLSLRVVDADHFSADTALRMNYPDTYRKFVALVGIKENRVDVSLIKHGAVVAYRYAVVASNQEIVRHIAGLSRETSGIGSITVYGPYLDNDLLVQIRRGAALLVEALNPLRHMKISDTLRIADHLSMPSYRFASAVGVALRRD